MNTKISKQRFSGMKTIAWIFIMIMVTNVILPVLTSRAIAGGPTQPEVESFSPISMTDMVDPFTGDFHYNIPLMDIEGYPINLVYNSGVSMEQEASWVGLGWNLNTGAIVRSMRGLPDDFSGDLVTKEVNQKPAQNFEIGFGAGFELFGKEIPLGNVSGGLQASMSLNYNTFNGYGAGFNFGPSFSIAKKGGAKGTAGFQLSGSSENGAGWSANANYSEKITRGEDDITRKSTSVAIGGNTRAGLQYFSFEKSRQNIHKGVKDGKVSTSSANGKLSSHYNFGLSSYTPSAGPNMSGLAISASFKLGGDLIGAVTSFDIRGAYSRQWISDENKVIQSPAYGFFALDKGQNLDDAQLDFNRDHDGAFTKYTPFLPSAHLTPDIFSVQAHGIDGSFRGFRNEVGYVFDPLQKSRSNDGSVAVETGVGDLLKWGIDVAYSHITSESGAWKGMLNNASTAVQFRSVSGCGYTEPYALQNASEMSVDDDHRFDDNFNSGNAVFFPLAGVAAMPILRSEVKLPTSATSSTTTTIAHNDRRERIKRNQALYFRTHEEMAGGMGINTLLQYPVSAAAQPHHIGEITELATDGRRYVFGLPVYNETQEDVTFAVGENLSGTGGLTGTPSTGLVNYNGSDQLASINNDKGVDHFYSATKTPAYAHSFMLTSILSDDYIDNDGDPGPSLNDLGSYVKFQYYKFHNFRWRSPIDQNKAYLNEGLKTDKTDDKASFTTGVKELAYVKTIETKNYVAVFDFDAVYRTDASSAVNRHGGTDNSIKMQQLNTISLYSRPEYEKYLTDPTSAVPIQQVHFKYSNELCGGYPMGGGKLTLTEVYFTYQNSAKMRRSSYKFDYASNPAYNMRDVDRWGNYQPQTDPDGMLSCDFPYTRQDAGTDDNAGAWLLSRITLPSGGTIDVEYESDDYAYVQNLPAMRMFKIMGVHESTDNIPTSASDVFVSNSGSINNSILVEMDQLNLNAADYAAIGDELYFRCLVNFAVPGSQTHEYISGYGKIQNISTVLINGVNYLKITLEGESIKDDDPSGNWKLNPITRSAIQYGRMHMARYIHNSGLQDATAGNDQNSLYNLATSMVGAIGSLGELFTGPNEPLYTAGNGKQITTRKSFVRLKQPKGKLGGGSRVSFIRMSDNWNTMAGAPNAWYGQRFQYVTEQGMTSGVASYEPQVGGDENPWRTAVRYADKKVMAPDDMLYMETPLMESLFPSPEVGYSRVVISDTSCNMSSYGHTSTGRVVKEFYTAKDFPTSVHMSDMDLKTMNSFLPGPKYQYLTASQGFSIELNDMHGKPKSEQVYSRGGIAPLSRVDYFYKSSGNHLENSVTVINNDGSIAEEEIGVRREGVADFRRSETLVLGGAAQYNVDAIEAGATITVPSVWPSVDISDNEFRSATMNKVINRFGLLERTVANQDGSIVETNNLAYDAETGEILVTQTTTDFNDAVYSVNFPAYWMYPQIAAAYSNINMSAVPTDVSPGGTFTIMDLGTNFYEGDEVEVRTVHSDNTVTYTKGWVLSATLNTINIVNKAGDPIVPDATEVSDSHVQVKVIRSGHRNKQTASMASLTMRNNPVTDNSLFSGVYNNVLNAGAIEFGEDWRTYCDCFDPSSDLYTTNPYVLGILGNWRPVKSLTYLTGRSQTNFHGNTNMRVDGVFTSFSPYYKYYNSGCLHLWRSYPDGWTYVSEVTEFSPNGMTLETRDALGRYSASKFGFNNTLTTAVAANTRLRQLEYASFEDNQYSNCTDQQLFKADESSISPVKAHSGYKSLHVDYGNPLTFGVSNDYCAPIGGCNLELTIDSANSAVLDIQNGVGPYTMETQLLAGAGSATLSLGDEIAVSHDVSRNFKLVITLHDNNGCVATYVYRRTPDEDNPNLEEQ